MVVEGPAPARDVMDGADVSGDDDASIWLCWVPRVSRRRETQLGGRSGKLMACDAAFHCYFSQDLHRIHDRHLWETDRWILVQRSALLILPTIHLL
jgi:hypothetical protein